MDNIPENPWALDLAQCPFRSAGGFDGGFRASDTCERLLSRDAQLLFASFPKSIGRLPQSESKNCYQDRCDCRDEIAVRIHFVKGAAPNENALIDDRERRWWKAFLGFLCGSLCLALYARMKG
jgi:hypothetical protein